MSDKNYEKFIPNDLTPDHILYKSLDMVVCDKLKKDKYYCVTNIINGIDRDYMKDAFKLKHSKLADILKEIYGKDTKKTKIHFENTSTELDVIFKKLNTQELTIKDSRCVIYLYLNQKTIIDAKNSKAIKNENYKDFIYKTLIIAKLIKEEQYKTDKNNFIFEENCNFKVYTIRNLSEFTKYIEDITNQNNNEDELFFRGHSNSNFLSTPTLFRDNYYKNEYEMFHELVVRCQENFYNCRNRFEFISLMQHYGLPTRLLDVTLNPLVALYFACENCSRDAAEVLVYRVPKDGINHSQSDTVSVLSNLSAFKFDKQQEIYKKNNKYLKELVNQIKIEKNYFDESIISDEDLNEPVFIIPERDNRRIVNQKGAFVLFGLNHEIYGDDTNNNDVSNYQFFKNKENIIIYINSNNKNKIMNQLKLFGIDKSFIYPEIDDVAEDIKNQYSQSKVCFLL